MLLSIFTFCTSIKVHDTYNLLKYIKSINIFTPQIEKVLIRTIWILTCGAKIKLVGHLEIRSLELISQFFHFLWKFSPYM